MLFQAYLQYYLSQKLFFVVVFCLFSLPRVSCLGSCGHVGASFVAGGLHQRRPLVVCSPTLYILGT